MSQAVVSSVGSGGGPRTRHQHRLHAAEAQAIRASASLTADEIIQELRPKLQRVPGINAYMQNPPAIRVGGQQSKSIYQYTLQDTNQDELQHERHQADGCACSTRPALPMSPPTWISTARRSMSISTATRPRPRAFRSQSIETALGASFGGAADFHHLCQRCGILGDAGIAAAISERHQRINLLYISSSMGGSGTGGSSGTVNAGSGTAGASSTSATTANSVPTWCR